MTAFALYADSLLVRIVGLLAPDVLTILLAGWICAKVMRP